MKAATAWNYKGQVHHKWCGGDSACLLAGTIQCQDCPKYYRTPIAKAVPEKQAQLFFEPALSPDNPLDLPIEDFASNPEPLSLLNEPSFSAWDEPPSEKSVESVCAYCGKYFIGASNKLYCSISCKKKAYKRRRARRGEKNRVFEQRICEVCHRTYTPHTDNQRTCGGACHATYMREKYRVGIPKNHTSVFSAQQRDMNMETELNAPVEHRREFVQQALRHMPQGRVPFSLHDCEATAARLDRRLFWWRTIAMPRQAVLLEIALLYGDSALFGMGRFLSLVRSGKWQAGRDALMLRPYAAAGRAIVENARQIVSGVWEKPIPIFIQQDDDEDDDFDADDYDEPEGYELNENGSVWER